MLFARSAGVGIVASLLLGLPLTSSVAADEPFTVAGEIEWTRDKLTNAALAQPPQDDVRVSEQEIKLQLSYRSSEFWSAFGEVKLNAQQQARTDGSPRISSEGVARGETWLYIERLFDGGGALQIGRQNISEPRGWWWDDELDAVRVHYVHEPWRLSTGVAEELARTSSTDDFIDPSQQRVRRWFGHGTWKLSDGLVVDAFFLQQRDRSKRSDVDSVIETARVDEADADLRWAGVRASGVVTLPQAATLSYWFDAAMVTGDETTFEFDDDEPGSSRVSARYEHRVRGRAIDLGTVWQLASNRGPALTVNYARGSGDADASDDIDHAFRQTGLQNSDREFRAYGELLRPELSNLVVAGANFGVSVHDDSRLSVAYHRFRQVVPATFLRAARIEADLTGASKDIGDELSLLVEVREWRDVQIELALAVFTAGEAFGTARGTHANDIFFRLTYPF
ncbi:MAG: alginate export family protein [Gammaproteobacteria bacterium]|nr:alginate export family protein [Gammaproteobacteria bacterium]